MKYLAASALIGAVTALTCSDFPKDSFNHAGCHMTVNFDQFNCTELETVMSALIQSWGQPNGDSCRDSGFPGFYSLFLESSGSCIWSSRLTANLVYTDDQIFNFSATSTGGCKVAAKSRSQSMSYLDNCVNYCNMWNVFTAIGDFTITDVSSCSETPDNAATTCARY